MTPEWVRCIAHTHADLPNKSWCGKDLQRHDKAFLNIDHAAYAARAEDRLVACAECVEAVCQALMPGLPK